MNDDKERLETANKLLDLGQEIVPFSQSLGHFASTKNATREAIKILKAHDERIIKAYVESQAGQIADKVKNSAGAITQAVFTQHIIAEAKRQGAIEEFSHWDSFVEKKCGGYVYAQMAHYIKQRKKELEGGK